MDSRIDHTKIELMSDSLRCLLSAWIGCILLPLPAIVLWRSNSGRDVALGLFFLGCSNLVAYAFQQGGQRVAEGVTRPELIWGGQMKTLGLALLTAFGVFSLLLLVLSDARDFVAVALAFLILIPSLCVAPYFTLLTRKQFAAAIFTLFAVFCMKLFGCVVVVLVYGWHADVHDPPYTDMPWTHPNLLVWLFWLNTGALSIWLYFSGRRRFIRDMTVPSKAPERSFLEFIKPPA